MPKGRRGGCLVCRKKREEEKLVNRIDRKERSKRTGQAIQSMDYEALAKYRLDGNGTRVWSF